MWRTKIHASLPWFAGRITIDSAAGEYAELIHRLNNDADVRRFLGGPLGASVEDTREKLNQAPDRLYMIKLRGLAVGYSGFIENDKTSAIDILIVLDPKYQGKGVGKETLQIMLHEFETRFPAREVALTTQRENIKAQSIILALGLQKTAEYEDILGFHYFVYKRSDTSTKQAG